VKAGVKLRYLFDTNIVIYYFNGLTADDALHHIVDPKISCLIPTS